MYSDYQSDDDSNKTQRKEESDRVVPGFFTLATLTNG
jgi:hypothetical protein